MPHLKRSEARQSLGVPTTPASRATVGPTQETPHLRCPVCGLMARLNLVEDGPHTPLYSRLEHYGGYSTIIWDSPAPATQEEYDLILARLEMALDRLRPRPPFIPPAEPEPPLEPAPTPARPRPAPARVPVTVAPTIPPFILGEQSGRPAAQALIRHLEILDKMEVGTPEMERELERLADGLEGWVDQVQTLTSDEEDKDRPNEAKLERLEEQQEAVEEAQAALSEGDIPAAIGALERAFVPRAAKVPKVTKPLKKLPKKLPIVEDLESQARTFRSRILSLREKPDRAGLELLEQEMLAFSDRVVDSADTATGAARLSLQTLAQLLANSADAFGLAFDSLARKDTPAYLKALDNLIKCCPA